jgi:hypothetical protein
VNPTPSGSSLARGAVATRLPAQDLQRARRFYADQLGLQPIEERPGGLRYRCRSGEFSLFESSGAPSGEHTQMAWEVDDLDATVTELRARGSPSRNTICRACTRPTRSPPSKATTPAPPRPASARPGSATAKATCSASASPSRDLPRLVGGGACWRADRSAPVADRPSRRASIVGSFARIAEPPCLVGCYLPYAARSAFTRRGAGRRRNRPDPNFVLKVNSCD